MDQRFRGRKAVLLWLLLACTVAAATEAASFLFLSVLEKQIVSPGDLRALRIRASSASALSGTGTRVTYVAESRATPWDKKHVVHPYLGFVGAPAFNAGGNRESIGFANARPSAGSLLRRASEGQAGRPIAFPPKRGSGTMHIGVFGGSVAEQLAMFHADALAEELRKDPRERDREIVVWPFALGSYKQPQQILTLEYALSLGAEFDVIVEVDGFNEVALAPLELRDRGTNPFFPAGWRWRIQDIHDPQAISLLGQISYLKQKRVEYATLAARAPAAYSFAIGFLWRALDRNLSGKIHRRETALQYYPWRTTQYAITGPQYPERKDGELVRDIAEHWKRSSVLMSETARSRGSLYLHYLQPNQYDPGSKPMNASERSVAYNEKQPYKPWVERGYPVLREKGGELAEEGVRFHDLSMMFQNIREPLYNDDCCHFGKTGKEMVMRRIAMDILAALHETP